MKKLLDWFKKKETPKYVPEGMAAPKTATKKKTDKELATERGEAYFMITRMEIDPNDINAGSFEFDWNDKMVADLIRHGYQMDPKDTDADIVDRWFTAVCRNVVLETYEQYQAMNPERDRLIKSRDIGQGRREVS